MRLLCLIASAVFHASAFIAPDAKHRLFCQNNLNSPALKSSADDNDAPLSSLKESFDRSLRIAQESSADGAGFKQIVASVLAGDYDASSVNGNIDSLINSAPCVMFIWEASPSCKSAISSMEKTGAEVKLVRLDDPWDEGNKMRAELGKRTGKTSVPSVWIEGKYVGGYDGGVGEESPGLVDLAFSGLLLEKLKSAGAIKDKA